MDARCTDMCELGWSMKRFHRLSLTLLLCFVCAGCGQTDSDKPTDYVGVFKSVRLSNDATVMVTITKDDGTLYEGSIDTLPVKGTWGLVVDESGGIITYLLNKGHNTYFFDFSFSIGGTVVSGTAYRQ